MAMICFLKVGVPKPKGVDMFPIFALERIVILTLLCCLLGCGSSLEQKIDSAHEIEEEFRKTCRLMQFEGDDSNYSVENRDLQVLRSVQGLVKAESGYYWDGGQVIFRVRSLDGMRTYSTKAGRGGKFSISSLPDGLYCYIAAAVGWQTEEGRILIHRSAPASAAMEISLIID